MNYFRLHHVAKDAHRVEGVHLLRMAMVQMSIDKARHS